MIPNPDTFARIREQAKAYASERVDDYVDRVRPLTRPEIVEMFRTALRVAYATGADAGYTAALAERREK